MNGTKVVLDTNVIILASKQQLDVEMLLTRYDEFYVSIITYMEVYAYDFEDEMEKSLTDELFANLEMVDISHSIADQSILYRKNKIKRIKLPDAIILATAAHLQATLLTDDWGDFKGVDNQVAIQSIDDLKL